MLIDIQNSIKAQESAGYSHWAKINNLKQAAKTMNFLKEHNIDSIEELDSKIEELNIKSESTLTEIKQLESKMSKLSLLMKYSATYRKLRPVYEAYKKSSDQEKYLRGHESDIILFEAANKWLRRMKIYKLPSFKTTKDEYDSLSERRDKLYKQHKNEKNEKTNFDVIKRNVDSFIEQEIECQTAHCGRCEQHFIVGAFTSPTVRFGR